jgi:hypothetical protein
MTYPQSGIRFSVEFTWWLNNSGKDSYELRVPENAGHW